MVFGGALGSFVVVFMWFLVDSWCISGSFASFLVPCWVDIGTDFLNSGLFQTCGQVNSFQHKIAILTIKTPIKLPKQQVHIKQCKHICSFTPCSKNNQLYMYYTPILCCPSQDFAITAGSPTHAPSNHWHARVMKARAGGSKKAVEKKPIKQPKDW